MYWLEGFLFSQAPERGMGWGEGGVKVEGLQPIDVEYVSDTRINTRIDGVLGSDAFDVLQAYCNTSTTQSSLD